MPLELFLIITSLELLVAITVLVPSLLPGKFELRPTFGIGVWLFSFCASALLAATAFICAVWISANEYRKLSTVSLSDTDLPLVLLVSFAPWFLLALVGVSLGLLNLRLQSASGSTAALLEAQVAVSAKTKLWRGKEVLITPLPIPVAGVLRRRILVSEAVWALPDSIRDAILWHELGHIRLWHPIIRDFGRKIARLLPGVTASHIMVVELNRLCELAADGWAAKRYNPQDLLAAKGAFQELFPTSLR